MRTDSAWESCFASSSTTYLNTRNQGLKCPANFTVRITRKPLTTGHRSHATRARQSEAEARQPEPALDIREIGFRLSPGPRQPAVATAPRRRPARPPSPRKSPCRAVQSPCSGPPATLIFYDVPAARGPLGPRPCKMVADPWRGRFSSAVEQRFCKPKVGSSILSTGTTGSRFNFMPTHATRERTLVKIISVDQCG